MRVKPSRRVVKDMVAAGMAFEEVDRVLRGRKSIIPVSMSSRVVIVAVASVTDDDLLKSDIGMVGSADFDIGMLESGGCSIDDKFDLLYERA